MKIWATKKTDYAECSIGMDVDGSNIDDAANTLYQMARNLFTEELEQFWQEGEDGKAFKYDPRACT